MQIIQASQNPKKEQAQLKKTRPKQKKELKESVTHTDAQKPDNMPAKLKKRQ
jgi:hypothetical protein